MFDKMFTPDAFENFFTVLPKSGESWLCIFIVMLCEMVSLALLISCTILSVLTYESTCWSASFIVSALPVSKR